MASFRLSLRRLFIAFFILLVVCWFRVLVSFLQSSSSTNNSSMIRTKHKHKHNNINHNINEPLAIVVGLPKSGTTSLYHFFSCNGYYTTHYCCCGSNETQYPCTNGRQMSVQLEENRKQQHPLLEGVVLPAAVGIPKVPVVHAQLDGELPGMNNEKSYFLPQHYFLEELEEAAPHAIWVLPLRPPDKWEHSVQNWLDIEDRLKHEYQKRSPQSSSLSSSSSSSLLLLDEDHFLQNFYKLHTQKIQEYCQKKRKKGSCIVVQIENDEQVVGAQLASLFPGTRSSCWGRHNAGPFFQAIMPPNANGG